MSAVLQTACINPYSSGHYAAEMTCIQRLLHPQSGIQYERGRSCASGSFLYCLCLQNAHSQVPLCSCRNGAPVVLINAAGVGQPAKIQISSKEQGEDIIHVIKVKLGIH
jgi:hypothetical protein